jgi:hypothetical protein
MNKLTYQEWYQLVQNYAEYTEHITSNDQRKVNEIIGNNITKKYFPEENKVIHIVAFYVYMSDQMK